MCNRDNKSNGAAVSSAVPESAAECSRRLVLRFDLRLFRLTAIKKAAYKFAARFHICLEACDDESVHVILSARPPLTDLSECAGEFNNEVLDQELREIIAEETQAVRDLLLAHAFSRVALIDPELETQDFRIHIAAGDRIADHEDR